MQVWQSRCNRYEKGAAHYLAHIAPELGMRLVDAAALDPRRGKVAAVEVRLEPATA